LNFLMYFLLLDIASSSLRFSCLTPRPRIG
jgi:hypothetical protein